MSQPTERCCVLLLLQVKRQLNSHGQESGDPGAKAIKQVAVGQTQEVVEERGNGEDQREPLILPAAVCRGQRRREAGGLQNPLCFKQFMMETTVS